VHPLLPEVNLQGSAGVAVHGGPVLTICVEFHELVPQFRDAMLPLSLLVVHPLHESGGLRQADPVQKGAPPQAKGLKQPLATVGRDHVIHLWPRPLLKLVQVDGNPPMWLPSQLASRFRDGTVRPLAPQPV